MRHVCIIQRLVSLRSYHRTDRGHSHQRLRGDFWIFIKLHGIFQRKIILLHIIVIWLSLWKLVMFDSSEKLIIYWAHKLTSFSIFFGSRRILWDLRSHNKVHSRPGIFFRALSEGMCSHHVSDLNAGFRIWQYIFMWF